VYDDATSRWTDCIQSVGSYFLDRLDISFCLCPLLFLIVRSCLARIVVLRLPRNSCKGVQRYHYPSLVRPEWRLRISEIRNRQSAPRVIPNLAKPSKSFLSEESVPLKELNCAIYKFACIFNCFRRTFNRPAWDRLCAHAHLSFLGQNCHCFKPANFAGK